MADKIKILDIINTASSARQLLLNRVAAVNRCPEFDNWVVCGPGAEVETLREAGIPCEVIDSPPGISLGHVSPVAVVTALARLYRFIRRERFDVVHTHGPVQGVLGRVAARVAGVPVIIHTEHGAVYHDNQNPLARALYINVERVMRRITHHLLFLTESEMEHAVRCGIATRSQARWIGNGIRLSDFSRTEAPPKRRDDGKVIIVSVARLDPVKNLLMLLRVMSRLRRTHPHAECWLLGDGVCREELERFAEEHRLSNVKFLGYRTNVAEIIARADIAVLTSIKEGVPRGLMEPMAMGVPVVATDVKGNRDVVADGECGFLAPLDDDAAFGERLAMLIGRPDLRTALGESASRRIHERYDEQKVIERILLLYREILRTRAWTEELPSRNAAAGGLGKNYEHDTEGTGTPAF
mgnify:CR=1 FL=1